MLVPVGIVCGCALIGWALGHPGAGLVVGLLLLAASAVWGWSL